MQLNFFDISKSVSYIVLGKSRANKVIQQYIQLQKFYCYDLKSTGKIKLIYLYKPEPAEI